MWRDLTRPYSRVNEKMKKMRAAGSPGRFPPRGGPPATPRRERVPRAAREASLARKKGTGLIQAGRLHEPSSLVRPLARDRVLITAPLPPSLRYHARRVGRPGEVLTGPCVHPPGVAQARRRAGVPQLATLQVEPVNPAPGAGAQERASGGRGLSRQGTRRAPPGGLAQIWANLQPLPVAAI
jgi:hypothetical protein